MKWKILSSLWTYKKRHLCKGAFFHEQKMISRIKTMFQNQAGSDTNSIFKTDTLKRNRISQGNIKTIYLL